MNENEHEYSQEQMAQEREMGLPATETPVELMKYILDPKTKSRYLHLTKDLAVTNFDKAEIQYSNNNLQLMHLLTYVEGITGWDLEDLKDMIDADIKGFAQVTRSKGGFERKAEVEKSVRQYQTVEEKKSRRWL